MILPDVQASKSEVAINLSRVGVTNVKKLVKVARQNKRPVILISTFNMYVDLPSDRRGANLSRNFEVIDEVLDRGGLKPADVKGVGLSGQMHGSVFLDAAGKVIRPALLWNDQRTAAQCEELFEILYRVQKEERFLVKITEAPHFRRYVVQREWGQAGVQPRTGAGHPGGTSFPGRRRNGPGPARTATADLRVRRRSRS